MTDHHWRHKTVARKVHSRDECRINIIQGQAYMLTKSIQDGGWYQHKACMPCDALAQAVYSSGQLLHGEGILSGDLHDTAKELDIEPPIFFGAHEVVTDGR